MDTQATPNTPGIATAAFLNALNSYFHFDPRFSNPAFFRSSGAITTRNSQSALNIRNHGSTSAGISDGSSRLT